MGNIDRFIRELHRRSVFRVGVAYAIVAWLIVQAGSTTFPALFLPSWILTLITVSLLIFNSSEEKKDSFFAGGMQQPVDEVRINVQLINTKTDEHLRAETCDQELGAANIFTIPHEISMAMRTEYAAGIAEQLASLELSDTDEVVCVDS